MNTLFQNCNNVKNVVTIHYYLLFLSRKYLVVTLCRRKSSSFATFYSKCVSQQKQQYNLKESKLLIYFIVLQFGNEWILLTHVERKNFIIEQNSILNPNFPVCWKLKTSHMSKIKGLSKMIIFKGYKDILDFLSVLAFYKCKHSFQPFLQEVTL